MNGLSLDEYRAWVTDPAHPDRMARLRAARHGNRLAFESIRDEFNIWREMQPKYPDVKVQLTGNDGNAFFVMGRVAEALRQAGVEPDEVAAFREECMSGDYDNLLATCMRWVDCL